MAAARRTAPNAPSTKSHPSVLKNEFSWPKETGPDNYVSMARYKEADSDQFRFVTLNFDELFPDDHPVVRLLGLIQRMDLTAFDSGYENDTGGRPALPPERILAVLFYAILNGNVSMRNLERDVKQRADLLFLSGGLEFDHSSMSIFRKRHEEAIRNLFTQTIFLGVEAGMMDLEVVCIDSTKIKASANRRDIGTRAELERRYNYVEGLCQKRYEAWRSAEENEHRPEEEHKIKKLEREKEKIAKGIAFLKSRQDRKRVHLTDEDADWRKGRASEFTVGYSVQTAVDSKNRMIVHTDVVQSAEDSGEAVPAVQSVEGIKTTISKGINQHTKYVLDAGYASEANLASLKDADVYIPDRELARSIGGKTKPECRSEPKRKEARFKYDAGNDRFICPAQKDIQFRREYEYKGKVYREYARYACGNCPRKPECRHDGKHGVRVKVRSGFAGDSTSPGLPAGPLSQAMRKKLDSPEGRKIYARRFPVVESVFGIIKDARNGWQFLRRGFSRVREEWIERCIAHNISVLVDFRRTEFN